MKSDTNLNIQADLKSARNETNQDQNNSSKKNQEINRKSIQRTSSYSISPEKFRGRKI